MIITYTVHGGSWSVGPAWMRSALRFWFRPVSRNLNLGFRIIEEY